MTVAAYRDRITGHYPITLDEVRRTVGILFGDEPTKAILDAAFVDPVEAVEPPEHDASTETITEGFPSLEGSTWRQSWTISPSPPPPVPSFVSPLQFRRAVRDLGLKTSFDAFVAALDEEGRETVEYATSFIRADPLIEFARQSLQWTQEQVDDVFRLAATR